MARGLALLAGAALFLALIPATAMAAPAVTGEFAVSDTPKYLTRGPDGNIWVTIGSKVARITPAGAVTEFDPAAVGTPVGITSGPDGNLWVTQTNEVGEVLARQPQRRGGLPDHEPGRPAGDHHRSRRQPLDREQRPRLQDLDRGGQAE